MRRPQTNNISEESLRELTQTLVNLGAGDARIIPAGSLVIEDRFAEMCASPRCPSYGLTPSCPPHVMKPAEFRELVSEYGYALAFKIDAPTKVLLSEGRRDVARLIHELASSVEKQAKEKGIHNAKGLAAGSCKMVFCHDHAQCNMLSGDGSCLFSDIARPSISGLGINFLELCKAVGWKADVITSDTDPEKIPMGMMAGLILIA